MLGLEFGNGAHRRNARQLLGNFGPDLGQGPISLGLTVVARDAVVNLDEVYPTHHWTQTIQRPRNLSGRRFISIKPGKRGPRIEALLHALEPLVPTIFKQASRHSTAGEPSPRRCMAISPTNDDSVLDLLDQHIGAWPQAGPFTQLNGNHDLSLCAYSLSHTDPV